MTQQELAEKTGINRSLISRIEKKDFMPSIPQLEALGEALGFEPYAMFTEKPAGTAAISSVSPLRIAVAGTGYVGLSIATLLAQHNPVTAVDIIPEKVDMINRHQSPIQDEYIEKYLAEKELNLTATLDGAAAYRDADFIIIAAPTNYDSKKNYFDTSAVESVIELVLSVNPDAIMVIKSTIPSATRNRSAGNITRRTLSSARSSYGNPGLCTTISIPAGLLSPQTQRTKRW